MQPRSSNDVELNRFAVAPTVTVREFSVEEKNRTAETGEPIPPTWLRCQTGRLFVLYETAPRRTRVTHEKLLESQIAELRKQAQSGLELRAANGLETEGERADETPKPNSKSPQRP